MSCGPGIANVPHFGCCGQAQAHAGITLIAKWYTFLEGFFLFGSRANPPVTTHYRRARLRMELSGGRIHDQVVHVPNPFSPPEVLSTQTTAWDIDFLFSSGNAINITPISVIRTVTFRTTALTFVSGTATLTLEDPYSPADLIQSVYNTLDGLTVFPPLSVVQPPPTDPQLPSGTAPRAIYWLTAAGAILDHYTSDIITTQVGARAGYFRPAFAFHHLGAHNDGGIPTAGVPFTYDIYFGNLMPQATFGLNKARIDLTTSTRWTARGTDDDLFGRLRGATVQPLSEVRCETAASNTGGILQPPAANDLGAAGTQSTPVSGTFIWAIPPHARPSGAIQPTCF